jgi:sporulation protein YlmC with PRC-barrel domain
MQRQCGLARPVKATIGDNEHMKRSTLISFVAACFGLGLGLGLAGSAIEAQTPANGTVNTPSASEGNVSATKPVPIADVPAWRQQQIASAQPVTSKNTPVRFEELLGTEVRSPQDELLGSVEDLVRNPQTDKIAYLVIAPDGSFAIDGKNVPIPLEDFKITPNANLLVLGATKGALDAAPRVNPFTTSGIDPQRQTVDAYWKAHLSN